MRSVLAVASVVWIFTCARGLVRGVLPADQRDWFTVAAATGGISIGVMTLIPAWVMMVWPGGPAFGIAFCASVLIWLTGRLVHVTPTKTDRFPGRGPIAFALAAACLSCCAAIVFNAAYWPFAIGDALALYAPFGRHLYETSMLPTGEGVYEAYPMLVPMAFALTHWASGTINEYVARLVPALMAVGVVGTGGLLARDMGSPGNGLLASALIAVTPVFARWASTGYTDVPAALYVGMTAIFVGRWWQTGTRRTLLLAGVSAGLAMWTKNSTLTLLPSLTWLLLSRRFLVRPAGEPRLSVFGDAGALLAGIGLTAAPWYLRNVLEFGLLVPPTVLTDRASHSMDTFTVMLRHDQQFGISGWLFTAAILYGSMTIVARGPRADRWYAPMALLMPFLAAWWWFASYEARFLVTVIPLLAAMSASMIDDVGGFIRMRLNPTGVRVAVFAIVAVIIGATAVSVRKAVEHKAILVHQPWLDNDERHRVRVGGLYDLAVALSGLPPASRVGGVPPMARYYLDRRRFARLEFATQRAAPSDLAHDYDYVVYEGLAGQTYAQRSVPEPLMRTPDGYVLFATKRQSARAAAQGRSADR